jgi:hypothetical protein
MRADVGETPHKPVRFDRELSISTSNPVKKHRSENLELLSERGEV